jgi:hypothetical protein
MLELIWAPLLGAFSLLFDEYSDPRLLAICLAGFEAATCLAAQLGVTQLRDVFVNSLCNFTHLHTPRWVGWSVGDTYACDVVVVGDAGRWSWGQEQDGTFLCLSCVAPLAHCLCVFRLLDTLV